MLYAAPGFSLLVPLPTTVAERVCIGPEFHVVPLADAADPLHAFLLAVWRGGHALWRVDRFEATPIDLHGAPTDMAEVTRFRETEKQLQSHATASGGAMVFHGHEESADRQLEPLRMYLREVDGAMVDAVGDDPSPVLLVGTGNLPAVYREISSIRSLWPDVIGHHPENLDEEAVAAMAAPVLDRAMADRTRGLMERIGSMRAVRRSSTIPAEVLVAAGAARVDTLLFDPGAEDATLVNRAVVATLRHGGTALPAHDLPSAVASIHRW